VDEMWWVVIAFGAWAVLALVVAIVGWVSLRRRP
jgi:hypothetical protein